LPRPHKFFAHGSPLVLAPNRTEEQLLQLGKHEFVRQSEDRAAAAGFGVDDHEA
jgi:hypothetical protein